MELGSKRRLPSTSTSNGRRSWSASRATSSTSTRSRTSSTTDRESAWILAVRGRRGRSAAASVVPPRSPAASTRWCASCPSTGGRVRVARSTRRCPNTPRSRGSRRSGAGSWRTTPESRALRCKPRVSGGRARVRGRARRRPTPMSRSDPPAGIELVNLAERPDLVPAVYEVDVEVGARCTEPRGGLTSRKTLERWHASYLEGPGALPSACIVALVGRRGRRLHGATPDEARPRRSRRTCSPRSAVRGDGEGSRQR